MALRSFIPFGRRSSLAPDWAYKVDASYAKGVLTVTVPKPPGIQQKGRTISVRRANGQQSAVAE